MKHFVALRAKLSGLLKSEYGLLLTVIFLLLITSVTAFGQVSNDFNIPVDDLFQESQTWIAALFPIFAIGGGISIAVVILRFVINSVVGAFRGNGG